MTALLPNLGGEEGPGWRKLLARAPIRNQARLWKWIFAPGAELLYDDADPEAWPEALGELPSGPAYAWLPTEGVVAWIVTEDAVSDGRVAGRAIRGPDADVVRAVHDKAFAHEVAREERLVPPGLRDCIAVLDSDLLRSADAADRIDSMLSGWPDPARARFTLKPRIGSSARGRVPGEGGRLDRATLGSALERLAARGGALLEPWLERTADFSVQVHVAPAEITLLGSLEQELAPSGRFLGHRGEIDSRGRIFSGHAEEERLREAAALVAVAAQGRGYVGPCGVDAFEYRDPSDGRVALRPVVEFNARFTAGTVTAGLIRRALPRVKQVLGLAPGERLAFRFRLDDPAPASEASDPNVLRIPLGTAPAGPTLRFSRARET